MTDDLKLWLRYVGGVAVVTVAARGAGQPLTDDTLARVVELERGRVVVEFPAAVVFTSRMMGKLILVHRRVALAHGAGIRLCCPEGPTREVLRLTKLDRVMPTFETVAEAVRG